LLWSAQLACFIGEGIFQTALIWWIIEKTGSGTMVGLITSISFLPAVLIGPFAGTLVDRMQPKVLLMGGDFFRAMLVAWFAFMSWSDALQIHHLFWLCGILSASGVFSSPTTLTVIPHVMPEEDIDEAMALHTIVRDISKLAGPAMGGMIIARWSVGHAFMGHAAFHLLSVLLIFIMKIPHIERETHGESVLTQLKAGLKYVWREKILRPLLFGFGVLNLFVVPIIVLLPMSIARVFSTALPVGEKLVVESGTENLEASMVYVGDYAIKGSMALGISEGILAFGSVITGIFFVKLFSKTPTAKLLIRSLIVNAGIFALFAVTDSFPVFALGLFFLGGCFTSVNVAVLSLFQRSVLPEMKGRFFAMVEVLSFALFPLALAATGRLTDILGLPGCYTICALGIGSVTIYLASQKSIRKIGAS
jgi:hypothetical protein